MNDYSRKKTRLVHIGPVAIGGGEPVSIQSMCNTPTTDVAATLAQLRALAAAGAQIGRLAVPDQAAAEEAFPAPGLQQAERHSLFPSQQPQTGQEQFGIRNSEFGIVRLLP